MKRCNHSRWLSLCTYGNENALLESDRLQVLTNQITDPDTQRPSLFVLIGNKSKAIAIRELFGVNKARIFRSKRTAGEIHLHINPASVFHSRPIFVADGDLARQSSRAKATATDKCHDTTRRAFLRPAPGSPSPSLGELIDSVYSRLLFPFADVFCFFSADLGGFREIARHIAAWLENGQSSTLPKSTCPRVVIVTERMPPGAEREKEARKAFLWLLREETTMDLSERISAVDVVAVVPNGKMSVGARHRRLKERLLNASDHVRKHREDTRTLFSATHFAAFFRYACVHFSETSQRPFHFILTSRKQNPIAPDLAEHLSNFLKHIRSPQELKDFAVPMIASSLLLDNYPPDSHMFEPTSIFQTLYKDVFYQVSEASVMAFEGSQDVILRSGFIKLVESNLRGFFEQLVLGTPSLEIHRRNLGSFESRWHNIFSSKTCFACLRRKPQYALACKHIVCENCVILFGALGSDDPWAYKVHSCFLCCTEMPEEIVVKEHPPTAGVGVLCIDGGGVRGVVPLRMMKRIQDCIDLPIPFPAYCKVIFGVSSGCITALAMGNEGWSVDKTIQMFEKFAKFAFERRVVLNIPIISRIFTRFVKLVFGRRIVLNIPIISHLFTLLASYFADGLYPADNIEAALKEVFGTKSILDCSNATSTGTKLGLLTATIGEPSRCIFTNYNGVGTRDRDQDYHIIQPEDGYGKIPLWEMQNSARSASAAPGYFPPKKIHGVGTFQDAGPLENDPIASAHSEVAALFPQIEEPDFIVSLGTGTARSKGVGPSMSISGPLSLWKYGAFPRLCRMFWEKMRDRQVRQIFRTHPRYHRLDVEFDGIEPRLDNTESLHELQLKVENDDSVSSVIENIARCAKASLFYFELDLIPEGCNGNYIGTGSILCSLRRTDPHFMLLLDQLSSIAATFYLNNCPIPGVVGDRSFIGKDGNFRKQVELNLSGKFTISLKQGDSDPCHISGSPYMIDKLISAQGFDAHFGRANHRKRKRFADSDLPAKRRQRV